MGTYSIYKRDITISDDLIKYSKIYDYIKWLPGGAWREYARIHGSYGNIDEFSKKGWLDGQIIIDEKIDYLISDLKHKHGVLIEKWEFSKYRKYADTWGETCNDINEKYLEIVLNARELDKYRTARRENRGRFIGIGFGVSGAIDASIKAGAMNLAMGAAHGLFNVAAKAISSIGDAFKKSSLYNGEETKTKLRNAMYSSVEDLVTAYWDVLYAHGRIKKQDLPWNDTAAVKRVEKLIQDMMSLSVHEITIKNRLPELFKYALLNDDLYIALLTNLGDPKTDLGRLCEALDKNINSFKAGIISKQISLSRPENYDYLFSRDLFDTGDLSKARSDTVAYKEWIDETKEWIKQKAEFLDLSLDDPYVIKTLKELEKDGNRLDNTSKRISKKFRTVGDTVYATEEEATAKRKELEEEAEAKRKALEDKQQRTVIIPESGSFEAKTILMSSREDGKAGRAAVQRYQKMLKSSREVAGGHIALLKAMHEDKTAPTEVIDEYKQRVVHEVLERTAGQSNFYRVILGSIIFSMLIALVVVIVLWASDQLSSVLSTPGIVEKLIATIWGYGDAHSILWHLSGIYLYYIVIADIIIFACMIHIFGIWEKYHHKRTFCKTYCKLFGKDDLERVRTSEMSSREDGQTGRDAAERYQEMLKSFREVDNGHIALIKAMHEDKTAPTEVINEYKQRIVYEVLKRTFGPTNFIRGMLGSIILLILIAIVVVIVLYASDQISSILGTPSIVEKLVAAIWGYGNAHSILGDMSKIYLGGVVFADIIILGCVVKIYEIWEYYQYKKRFCKTYCKLFGKDELERIRTS